MWSKGILHFISILLSLILSYIIVNRLAKYSKKINKYKYVAYITAFAIIYLGSIQLFSVLNPGLMENYQDLLEHITIPKKFQTKPKTSIDMSVFEQKQITPSVTTVIKAPTDEAREKPVAYVDPTPPPPPPTAYVPPPPEEHVFTTQAPYTGFTGFTGHQGSNIEYTGYTGYTGIQQEESIITPIVAPSGYTGYTQVAESGYTGYTGIQQEVPITPTPTPTPVEEPKFDMSNLGSMLPLAAGLLGNLLTKQPQVNVNVYNDGDGNGYANSNNYQMDNCLSNRNRNQNRNRNNNNELYNYRGNGEKVRAYDYWKRTIDKDNDYILMDQNKVNRMYNNPRSSSCPVCPLDINYPFSNYRSGR